MIPETRQALGPDDRAPLRCVPWFAMATATVLMFVGAQSAEAITVERLSLPTGDGWSVSDAGDVNRDGFDDLIVSRGGDGAILYYGGPDPDPPVTYPGFVQSVSGAGDIDQNGYADVILGRPGEVEIFFGGSGPPSVRIVAEEGYPKFGDSVSDAGDVNGDGCADVIVGASFCGLPSCIPFEDGRAYVFFGGDSLIARDGMTAAAADLKFDVVDAASVSGAGDMNGDGFDDVIVGIPTGDGRAEVYFGAPDMDSTPDLTYGDGSSFIQNFGRSVSDAGDLNGDGYGDVAVGGASGSSDDFVGARVFFGGPGGQALLSSRMILGVAGGGSHFSWMSVSGAGDVNGDGLDDLVLGAPGDVGELRGRAYVFWGDTIVNEVDRLLGAHQADLTFDGEATRDSFGYSVSGAGDLNDDGYADLIAGAPGNDVLGDDAGRVYVLQAYQYQIGSPKAGETWHVGARKTIDWRGLDRADLWLSVDGGFRYQLLRTDVGGSLENALELLVPHTPTKFALVKLSPTDSSAGGVVTSDSLFTIKSSVATMQFRAAPLIGSENAAVLTWQTDPGPEELAGYRLEKAAGSGAWQTIVSLTRETSYTDSDAGLVAHYRLFSVNGLGGELMLGETTLQRGTQLSAWPLPYRGGELTVSFATAGAPGGAAAPADVSLHDVSGRRVRTVARGTYAAGLQSAVWDGRDQSGRNVAAGVYFLRAQSAGEQRTMKLLVVR